MSVITGRIGSDHYRTTLATDSGHQLLSDEPLANGGQNLGPSPGDLLAAALSACTCITLRMYADRKQWPLQGVECVVQPEHDDKHVVTRLTSTLYLRGELTAEQRQRLLRIAGQCPIHKTLGPAVPIVTTLA